MICSMIMYSEQLPKMYESLDISCPRPPTPFPLFDSSNRSKLARGGGKKRKEKIRTLKRVIGGKSQFGEGVHF